MHALDRKMKLVFDQETEASSIHWIEAETVNDCIQAIVLDVIVRTIKEHTLGTIPSHE